jgi:hypothetical protein
MFPPDIKSRERRYPQYGMYWQDLRTLIFKFGIKSSVYINFILKMFRIEKIQNESRRSHSVI